MISGFQMISTLARLFNAVNVNQLGLFSTKIKMPIGRPPGYLAPTSFALYLKDFSENSPAKTPTETVIAAAKSWKDIDDESRKAYQEKSKQIDQEKKSAYERLSDEDKLKLHDEHDKVVDERNKRKKRRERRELNEQTGRPKLPPTAFAIFLKEFYKARSASHPEDSSAVIMIEASKAWQELSLNFKEKYKNIADDHKNKYNGALKEWKAAQNELEEKEIVSKKKVLKPLNVDKEKEKQAMADHPDELD